MDKPNTINLVASECVDIIPLVPTLIPTKTRLHHSDVNNIINLDLNLLQDGFISLSTSAIINNDNNIVELPLMYIGNSNNCHITIYPGTEIGKLTFIGNFTGTICTDDDGIITPIK